MASDRPAVCFKDRVVAVMVVLLAFHIKSGWSGKGDATVLLNFKNSLSDPYRQLYNWNETSNNTPCSGNWTGVHCSSEGDIDKLTLENMGLSSASGSVFDLNSLASLPKLKALSFMNNSFEGAMPGVSKLTSLRTLYLSLNYFSGPIPVDAFTGMNSLTQLYLGNNNFTGPIPSSLLPLTKLVKLSLENNQFEGSIPDFHQQFVLFNISNNHLNGRIPPALAGFDPSAFAGNPGLCGKPLAACKSSKKKTLIIIVVVAGSVVALAALIALAYLCRGGTKTTKLESTVEVKSMQAQTNFAGTEMVESPETGEFHFVRNDRERFEVQELLRASAEVLGSSDFGPSYKAAILDGSAMVVKRFREMSNARKLEFHEHMNKLGKLSHPNLLPLIAFYYRKDEKLLVSDFIENGSLDTHLHGLHDAGKDSDSSNNGGGGGRPKTGLDWPSRLKIIKGIARGLAYLHKEFPSSTLPHGHLKSSNVLLDHTFEPLLTEYGLAALVNRDHAHQFMVAHKSPEFSQYGRTSRKTDVWSLGILILEMLTGKFPGGNIYGDSTSTSTSVRKLDLATWVNSVVREEWTGEVFDMNMRGTKNGEGEMLKLLKIGMCCCETKPDRRWDLKEAVDKIEQLKERDSDFDDLDLSSYASEGELYSSRAITDDDFSFSINNI